ncbi:MAG: hypothetical protein FJ147_28235 [Deltaproteobacteria bacterium]|nr:hypothetical protein [Deltaproteobacteria bacterium]
MKHMTSELFFAPFRLDPANEQLWHGAREIVLRRKTFAVLSTLVEQAGQLVTKAQLLAAVWGKTCVSDATLATSIRELRYALKDDADAPRYIETVHGRGYRFVAMVEHMGTPDDTQTLSEWLTLCPGKQREVLVIPGGRAEIPSSLVDVFRQCLLPEEARWIRHRTMSSSRHDDLPSLPTLEAVIAVFSLKQ